jgi:tetratricopeptide (TPR) repeat protein
MRKRSHSTLALASLVAIALIVLPVLVAQENDQAQARMNAMALEQKGLNAEAEQIWSTIAKADPGDAEALAHLGLLEAREEHFESAIDDYRKAIAINPDLPGLEMNLGLALFKVAQFPDAIKSFSSEIRKHPGDLRLTVLLGMSHYGMKDYLVAIPYLKRATERDPQSVPLRLVLAHSCMRSKQYQCVLNVHKETLALMPTSAEADLLAGEALDQMGDSLGATKELRAAVVADPHQPKAHFGLGYLLWTENKWPEAASEFQLELQNDPGNLRASIYLADSWVQENEFAKALPELDKLVPSNGSEPMVHLDLGLIYANSGRNDDAVRELRMASQLDPEDPEPHIKIAKLYQAVGKRKEAYAELEKAKELSPQIHESLVDTIDSAESPTP